MALEVPSGQTSNKFRVLLDTAGLAYNTATLVISTIADNEATATVYAVDSSNVEDITTLGTYAAPTSGKCRFKQVDATNHPKLYEIQLSDARLAVANARSMVVTISGGGITTPTHYEIELAPAVSGYKRTAAYDYLVSNLGVAGAAATEAGGTGDHLTGIPKTGYSLSASGLAAITAWTVDITGSLSGSVGSVTAGVTVTTNNDKTNYILAPTGLDQVTAWAPLKITGLF